MIIGSFDVITGVDPKGLSKAEQCKVFYKALPKLVRSRSIPNISNYRATGFNLWYLDGKDRVAVYEYGGAPCHAFLRRVFDNTTIITPLMVQTGTEIHKHYQSSWVDWIIRDSVFKDAYLRPYGWREKSQKLYGVLTRCDIDSMYQMAALSAVRIHDENEDLAYFSDKLRSLGFDAHLSAHVSYVASLKGEIRKWSNNTNHDSFCGVEGDPKKVYDTEQRMRALIGDPQYGLYCDVQKWPNRMCMYLSYGIGSQDHFPNPEKGKHSIYTKMLELAKSRKSGVKEVSQGFGGADVLKYESSEIMLEDMITCMNQIEWV